MSCEKWKAYKHNPDSLYVTITNYVLAHSTNNMAYHTLPLQKMK